LAYSKLIHPTSGLRHDGGYTDAVLDYLKTTLNTPDLKYPTTQTQRLDIVDIRTIDLYSDEYANETLDEVTDEMRRKRFLLFWRLYDMLA
jgi:hypothetical protein